MSTGAMHEWQFWPGICWYNAAFAICLSFIGPCWEKTILNCSFNKSALEDELVNTRSPAFKEAMPDLSVRACLTKDQDHLIHLELSSCCKLLSRSSCSNMLFTQSQYACRILFWSSVFRDLWYSISLEAWVIFLILKYLSHLKIRSCISMTIWQYAKQKWTKPWQAVQN